MPEVFPDQPSAFARLRPEDFEPPVWEELPSDVLERLTEEGGPGIVTEPATQREFASAQELIPDYASGMPGHSGLAYYFAPGTAHGGGFLPDMLRALPVFRRLQILYPELVAELRRQVPGRRQNAPHELHEPLFAAYRIMRHLVDKKDPHIVHPDGTVDDSFLTR